MNRGPYKRREVSSEPVPRYTIAFDSGMRAALRRIQRRLREEGRVCSRPAAIRWALEHAGRDLSTVQDSEQTT